MKNLIRETFNKEYNEECFKRFINELLTGANFEKAHMIQIPPKYTSFIRSCKRIAKYKYEASDFAENVIDVLVVKLKRTSSIDRARSEQRNFVARYLNESRGYLKDAALVAFISEDDEGKISDDWRFSLIKMDYVTEIVEDASGQKKRKTTKELTPAKRFSFLVGTNEDSHTAQKQLCECLEKSARKEKVTLDDLVKAFDIEKVSKEFFDEYKNLYLKLKAELERLYNSNSKIKTDFDEHNINTDDFAKKTLGQLVFLYFIQKKGWMGVGRDADWGKGDKKFLRNLFEKKYVEYKNFFNDVLEPLFYQALASDRGASAWFDSLKCRIPFLNGGLFEPINGYEYDKTDLTINNNLFAEIFKIFDLYNFTVKEDEPLEKEVAIDPEMLGKVFENLLPENIRKGNGAFYTPREIVHYMCQESLINYLYTKVNTKNVPLTEDEKKKQLTLFKKEKKQEQLVLTKEVFEEIVPKEDISVLIHKGDSQYINEKRGIEEDLPQSIKENARAIDKALEDIKVCDPAIGSGAFPVGMMNEIIRARMALNNCETFKNNISRTAYNFKRHTIENSIYGVDIDSGAVEIAKLRFWLSLVVDEESIKTIKPLPNLDYKIMQGNSLISSYEGIDFDEIVENYKPNTQLTLNLFDSKSKDIIEELRKKQLEFLNTPYSTKKGEIKQEIEELIVELIKAELEERAKKSGKSEFDIEDHIRNFAQNKENRNFFPWKLFFADAFENGGFDVVIGNPPYVQLQKFKGDPIQKLYKDANFKVHDSNGDIYCLFYEKGVNVLKNQGYLCFITSNKWMRAGYGEKLRAFFTDYTNPVQLIDFAGFTVFDSATVDVNILLTQKTNNKKNTLACSMGKNFNGLNQLSVYISQNSALQKFNSNSWCILNPLEQSIKEKIEKIGTPLKNWDVNIYRGVLTGLNEAFIIDGVKKDELIRKDPKSAEIIRPILRGRDIKRYDYDFADKWIINTHNGSKTQKRIDVNNYPAIKEHFDQYYEKLAKRDDQGDTPYNLRCCAYMDDY